MASLTHNGVLALKERTHGASTGVISSTMIKRLGIIFNVRPKNGLNAHAIFTDIEKVLQL